MNDLPAKIKVHLKTSGFNIISFHFKRKERIVEIDIGNRMKSMSPTDVAAFSTQSFLIDFTRELGKDIVISGFEPDSIVVNFSDRITRSVPIDLQLKLDLEKQFDTTGSVVLSPATVEVSGPPSVVNSITSIRTEPLVLNDVKGSVKATVKLITDKYLIYSTEIVNVSIPVEKFTEGTVEVPVVVENLAKGYSLKTFPDKVKIRFLVSLSKYNRVNPALFHAIVDASNIEKQHPKKVIVLLVDKPAFIRVPELENEKLDYIMRKE